MSLALRAGFLRQREDFSLAPIKIRLEIRFKVHRMFLPDTLHAQPNLYLNCDLQAEIEQYFSLK
jgi:hypothetical protein